MYFEECSHVSCCVGKVRSLAMFIIQTPPMFVRRWQSSQALGISNEPWNLVSGWDRIRHISGDCQHEDSWAWSHEYYHLVTIETRYWWVKSCHSPEERRQSKRKKMQSTLEHGALREEQAFREWRFTSSIWEVASMFLRSLRRLSGYNSPNVRFNRHILMRRTKGRIKEKHCRFFCGKFEVQTAEATAWTETRFFLHQMSYASWRMKSCRPVWIGCRVRRS